MDINTNKDKEFELHKFIAKASREDAMFLTKYINYKIGNNYKESDAMAKAYWYQSYITPHQEALQLNPNDFQASKAILSYFKEGIEDQFLEDAKRSFGKIKPLDKIIEDCSQKTGKYDLLNRRPKDKDKDDKDPKDKGPKDPER